MATPFEKWFDEHQHYDRHECKKAWDAAMEYVLNEIDVIKAKRKETK